MVMVLAGDWWVIDKLVVVGGVVWEGNAESRHHSDPWSNVCRVKVL